MTHKYTITGMSCNGCKSKVEKALNTIDGIKATVFLETNSATITMEKHFPTYKFQEILSAIGNYQISDNKDTVVENSEKATSNSELKNDKKTSASNSDLDAKYHCPMHCEGDKDYDKAGDCPVCGMNLEKVHELNSTKTLFTCPMHHEIIQDHSGSCPICGMDLVPMQPSDSEEQKTYKNLVKKMKVAVLFTVPIFIIAMMEMMENNQPSCEHYYCIKKKM